MRHSTWQFYLSLSGNKTFWFFFSIQSWSELLYILVFVNSVQLRQGMWGDLQACPRSSSCWLAQPYTSHVCFFWNFILLPCYIMHFHVHLCYLHFSLPWELPSSVCWVLCCNISGVQSCVSSAVRHKVCCCWSEFWLLTTGWAVQLNCSVWAELVNWERWLKGCASVTVLLSFHFMMHVFLFFFFCQDNNI